MTKEEIRARFAANLRALRAHMGQTQDVMAHALDVKRSSLSGYLNGTAEPNLELLHRIALRYGVGEDVLLSNDLFNLTEVGWKNLRMVGGSRTLDGLLRK